jgi:hypothetical protein
MGRRAPDFSHVCFYTGHTKKYDSNEDLQVTTKKTHTWTNMTTLRRNKTLTMKFDSIQRNAAKKQTEDNHETTTNNSVPIEPPTVVETVISSSQSLMSSIGIGEFGMNQACKGSAVAFSMAVRDHLFPKLKFLKGMNASLDFSMDATSIFEYLHVCCGVSEADAYQWWNDHRMMLKNIHTDFRNNKIKMIKQQFNGKLQQINNVNVKHQVNTLSSIVDQLGSGKTKM